MERKVSLEDIEKCLSLLGGESHVSDIKKEMLKLYGEVPNNYASPYTFNNTIQKIIEDHCPESENYKSERKKVFRRVSKGVYRLFESKDSLLSDCGNIQDLSVDDTTKRTLIDARVGQGLYRDKLIQLWGGCAVTGLRFLPILRASHIKPWSSSSNAERLDMFNGLLLTANLDALFDKGYVSFQDDGSILLSSRVKGYSDKVGVNISMRLSRVCEEHIKYLCFHRENVFKKS